MPDTPLPFTKAKPALLLIGLDRLESSERAAQLQSEFCVTRADNPGDMHLMATGFAFSVAVLSDTIGFLALRASAQVVRTQWPKARIVILGKAPSDFDDQLYDETVGHSMSGGALLGVIKMVLEDARSRMGHDAYAAWLARVSLASRFQQDRVPQESDPRKVAGPVREAQDARDWPAAERLRQMAR